MKTAFIIVLLGIGISFFSQRAVFEKKFGLISLSGLELYLLGILFSFLIGKEHIIQGLYAFIYVILAFIGFDFGMQFEKNIVSKLTFRQYFIAFLISLIYFPIVFLLDLFHMPFPYTIAAVSMIPSSYILYSVSEKLSGLALPFEVSTVFVLLFYTVVKFGITGSILPLATVLLAAIFVWLIKIISEKDVYILTIGFLLLISAFSEGTKTSAIFSAMIFGISVALLGDFSHIHVKKFVSSLERPFFLSLLFFSGIFFSLNLFVLAFILAVGAKGSILLPFYRRHTLFVMPFGALSIAVAMEGKNIALVTSVAVFYFVLIFVEEILRRLWDI